MHVKKRVICNLNKCYAMSEVTVEGRRCFVAAAEQHDPCYLFSEEGELLEKVWDEPGGVMTMARVPGADGQFLAIHKFYSPDDSADAKIVIVTRRGKGDWGMTGALQARASRRSSPMTCPHLTTVIFSSSPLYTMACSETTVSPRLFGADMRLL